MKISIEITAQQIADNMVAAIEGGSNYWMDSVTPIDRNGKITVEPWYSDPNYYDIGFSFTVNFDDPKLPAGNHKGKRWVGTSDLIAGLMVMASKYPARFGELISDQGDQITADVFFQCVVLQDVPFG